MAAGKYTYVVQSMGQSVEGKVVVTLNEEMARDSVVYVPAGSLTINVDIKDAGKYVPGTRFNLTLSEA